MVRTRPVVLISLAVLSLVTLATCRKSPAEPTPLPCEYALAQTDFTVDAAGGARQTALVTRATCEWQASTTDAWISVTTPAGTGNGSVGFVVAANAGAAARVGHLTVQNVVVTVTQAGKAACTYDVAPQSLTFDGEGGNGALHVSAASGCAWTASTTADWISILNPGPGTGDGNVTFAVARHTGSADRTGVLTVAGVNVAITQRPVTQPPDPTACNYAVAPTEFILHWHQTGGDISLTTTAGCTWTATPGDAWLSAVTPAQGSGSATVTFKNAEYTDEITRRAPVQIRWPTATAGQNVWVTQEGCYFALSKTNEAVVAAGTSSNVVVFADPVSSSCPISCTFTASTSVPWIRITSQGTNPGMRADGYINYVVDPNTTGSARTGVISVKGKTLTIVQSGT